MKIVRFLLIALRYILIAIATVFICIEVVVNFIYNIFEYGIDWLYFKTKKDEQ